MYWTFGGRGGRARTEHPGRCCTLRDRGRAHHTGSRNAIIHARQGQEGWRARANAAQANTFEALPFFYAAVLFALYNQAPAAHVATLMACWLGTRLGYVAMYLANWGALRSLVWTAGVGFVIAILFAGV